MLLAALMICLGCAKVNYIGESYPPTQHVDLYISEEDIEVDYKVIGRIIATANATSNLLSDEEFQEKIMIKAREKGADGVIILGFDQVLSAEPLGEDITEKRRVEAIAIKYEQ
jgi:hypothetical protein